MKVGQTDTEKKSKSLQKCREIVAELNNFGVNDFERVQIIHLILIQVIKLLLKLF